MKFLVQTPLEEIRAKEAELAAEKETVKRLESEKEMLLETVMEMSTYIANQDERLNGQESAIMELSTLVALQGGEM